MLSFSSASSSLLIALARRGAVVPVGSVVLAGLIAGVGLVAVAPAQAAQGAAGVKAARVDARPDLLSARVGARAQGSRVEVESLRDATSSTWVNPDGTLTTQAHAGPIRFRGKDGAWRDVDLSLAEQPDGSVAPKGHPGGLRLAGSSKTASLAAASSTENDVVAADQDRSGSRQVSLAWSGRLGKPVLSGTTATYADVQPGVDLVVQALRTGFEQSFIIKDAAALARLQSVAGAGLPVSWAMPVKTKGLSARAETDGSVSFVDAKGTLVSRFAAPTAWDAKIDPRSGDHASTAAVQLTLTQAGKGKALVTVTPDPLWLADPARVFPVTVDPSYQWASVGAGFDTFVQSGITSDQSTSTSLSVGTYNGGTTKARAFINFPLAAVRGKQIMAASLKVYETHAYPCPGNPRVVNVKWSGDASTGTRWTAQPALGSAIWGSANVAVGNDTCGSPDAWVDIPITALVQAWSGYTTVNTAVMLQAASETDTYGWKKFASMESAQDPYVAYTYNRGPAVAPAPGITGAVSYAAPGGSPAWYLGTSTPDFYSSSSDPDGNSIRFTHNSYSAPNAPQDGSGFAASCVSGWLASPATGHCQPAPMGDGTYYARTAVQDDQGAWAGPWSPYQGFTVAAHAPGAAPGITCPQANNTWTDVVPPAPLVCTVSAPGSGASTPGYVRVSVDGSPVATNYSGGVPGQLKIDPSPGSASVSVSVPASAGGHVITATAENRAGLLGPGGVYSFGYGPAGMTAPAVSPRTTTTGAVNIVAAGPPKGAATLNGAVVQWRVAASGQDQLTGWNNATSAPLTPTDNGAAGIAVTGSWDASKETLDAKANISLNSRVPVLLDVQVCFNYSTGTQCTWRSSAKLSVVRVPHAFGSGFPTATAGPGQVALWTGEFNTTATDVAVPGYTGDLSLSRSHSTFAGAPNAVNGVFGPGWIAQLDGGPAGQAGMQVVDNTAIDASIALLGDDGTAMVWATGTRRTGTDLAPGTYTPAEQDTIESGMTLSVAGTGAATTITVTETDGTKTVFTAIGAPVAGQPGTFAPTSVAQPGVAAKTSYTVDAAGHVTRILAPLPPGLVAGDCPQASGAGVVVMKAGCRGLRIEYAQTTGGTAVAGQVAAVYAQLFDPLASAMVETKVASYAYDPTTKRLVTVTDNRTNLSTSYAYEGDANAGQTRITSITAPGLTPITFAYAAASNGANRLVTVTRARPVGDPTGGVATLAAISYDIPTSGTAATSLDLPDLSAATVSKWNQGATPTYGAAVFGPDAPSPGSAGSWVYADLSYTDAAGYTINTASYGAGAWQYTATDYDTRGNPTRTLDGRATRAVLDGTLPVGGGVDQVGTLSTYNADATLVTDVFGPGRQVTLPDGTSVFARPHTHTDFDQGAPNNNVNPATSGPYHLPTTATASAYAGGVELSTTSMTRTGYDKITPADPAEGDGWALGAPTRVTQVMSPDGTPSTADLVRVTRHDTEGRVTQTRQPSAATGAPGTDAGTTNTSYYTLGANPADPACGATTAAAAWAGLACHTSLVGPPSTGPTLPDTTTGGYNMWLAPTSVTQVSGAATRTITTGYDPAGRPSSASTATANLTGSVPVAATATTYDPATGAVTAVTKLDGNGAPTSAKITTTYDGWGRPTGYKNEGGEVTSTGYDGAGRTATITDPKGTTTYGYDGTDAAGNTEHRALPTSVSITRGGASPAAMSAAYDAAGALTLQKLPGGLVARNSYDIAGEQIGASYSGQVTSTDPVTGATSVNPDGVWLAWAQTNDIAGRVAREWTPAGSAAFNTDPAGTVTAGSGVTFDRAYAYDRAGRLTTAADRTAATTGVDVTNAATAPACTTRAYVFDANSNRTALTSTPAAADGSCTTTNPASPATTTTHAYDSADRATTGGGGVGAYTYDPFGRQSTLPAADAPNLAGGDITLGYFDTDQPATITAGATTTAFTMDAAGRRLTQASGPTGQAPTSTLTRHYADTSDNPGWVSDQAGAVTRYGEPIGGNLALTIDATTGATTLDLAKPALQT